MAKAQQRFSANGRHYHWPKTSAASFLCRGDFFYFPLKPAFRFRPRPRLTVFVMDYFVSQPSAIGSSLATCLLRHPTRDVASDGPPSNQNRMHQCANRRPPDEKKTVVLEIR